MMLTLQIHVSLAPCFTYIHFFFPFKMFFQEIAFVIWGNRESLGSCLASFILNRR